MRPTSSQELFQILQDVSGGLCIETLVLRHTGSVEKLFDSLVKLQEAGLVEIKGNEAAVESFIHMAKELERQGLEDDELRKKLYKTLRDQPSDVRNAQVLLTQKGLFKSTYL